MEKENTVRRRGIGTIVLSILKFIGFMVLALVPMQMVMMLLGIQDYFSTIVNSILGLICFILIVFIIIFLWNRYYTYSKEKVEKIGLRDLGYAILFFVIARVIAVGGTFLISLLYGEEMTANDEALMSLIDYSNTFVLYFILFVLSLGILVPIAEELVYRGIGTNLLLKNRTFWLPLIITSIIFGLMHTPTNVISFLLYSSIGVVFFLAYYRRKNIVDSILVHILNNGLSAIFLLAPYIMEFL